MTNGSQRRSTTRRAAWMGCFLVGISVMSPASGDESAPTIAARPRGGPKGPGLAAGLGVLGFGLGHYYAGDSGSGNTYLLIDSLLLGGAILLTTTDNNDDGWAFDAIFDAIFWGVYGASKGVLAIVQGTDAYGEAREHNRSVGYGASAWRQPDFAVGLTLSHDGLLGRPPSGLGAATRPRLRSLEPTRQLRVDPVQPAALLAFNGSA